MFTLKVERDAVAARARCGPMTRVQVWRDLDDEVCAYGFAGAGWWSMEWPRLGTFRFGPTLGDTMEVIPEAGVSLPRLEDLHRRSVLPLALQALGRETLHASAIRLANGVAAFCGARGAGKSTVAYALCRRGYEQRADDTLVLSFEPDGIRTYPLPFTPRLRPASADFFATGTGDELLKATEKGEPEPLAAIFVLLPTAHASEIPAIERLPPTRALRAALGQAHCFDTGNAESRRRLLRNYLEVAACVPVFNVMYRPGLERLDSLLDLCVAAAGEPARSRSKHDAWPHGCSSTVRRHPHRTMLFL